jgi:hypothetical protein
MPRKSTTALILETVMTLSTDMADMKARIFNGMGKKIEALWAWKEQYPSLCSFQLWLKQHPEMSSQVEEADRGRSVAKKERHRKLVRALLLMKDFILAAAAAWGLGRGLGWW